VTKLKRDVSDKFNGNPIIYKESATYPGKEKKI
jgi:hypothetical protein